MAKKKASWAEIFSNATAYPDDFVIAIKDKDGNDASYTMGDLRAYNEEHDGALLKSLEPEREKLEGEKQQVVAAREEVLRLFRQDGDATRKLEEGKKVTKKDVADQFELDESDPLVGSLVKQLNAVKGDTATKLEAITQAMTQQGNILKTVLGTYINRSVAEQYRALKSDIDGLPEKSRNKYSLKVLREHAEKGRWNDSDGMPDIARAFRDLAGEEIYAARRARDSAEDRKKWEQEQRMAITRELQTPHVSGDRIRKPPINVLKSKDPLGDALSQALQDDEILSQFAGDAASA